MIIKEKENGNIDIHDGRISICEKSSVWDLNLKGKSLAISSYESNVHDQATSCHFLFTAFRQKNDLKQSNTLTIWPICDYYTITFNTTLKKNKI